jgi:hypothetical protein
VTQRKPRAARNGSICSKMMGSGLEDLRHIAEEFGSRSPRSLPLPLQLDKLGKMGDQLGDPSCFVMGQPAIVDCDCAIRLAIGSSRTMRSPSMGWYLLGIFDRPGLGNVA